MNSKRGYKELIQTEHTVYLLCFAATHKYDWQGYTVQELSRVGSAECRQMKDYCNGLNKDVPLSSAFDSSYTSYKK